MEILDEVGLARDGLLETLEVHVKEQRPANRERRQRDDEQRRKDPDDSTVIEVPQAGNEAEVLIFDQRVGDDEAGDDEEDIDADEAARHAAEMVHDHHQNGECPDVFDLAEPDRPD